MKANITQNNATNSEEAKTINPFDESLARQMLQTHSTLSIVSIHTPKFKEIATEYGNATYDKLMAVFEKILIDLWGKAGSFRAKDILCSEARATDTYYILLQQARTEMPIPRPLDLERLAERIFVRLSNALWEEVCKPSSLRELPNFFSEIPEFMVGHSTVIYNPCAKNHDTLRTLLRNSLESSTYLLHRFKKRHQELIQQLIANKDFLIPHYQAVFFLKDMTEEEVLEAEKNKSIKNLSKHIYGFESLIRVNASLVTSVLDEKPLCHIDAKFLRPDVLFFIAHWVNLTLELDQACFKQAIKFFKGLQGKLLVNILPRNFYHIDILKENIPKDIEIVFEVSESEAISNYELLKAMKHKIATDAYEIAIDDFGKGYSSLDRILQIKPEVIKLDRNLIIDINTDESKKAFVKGIIDAAKITKATVLAEGVELIEEFRELKTLGVDLIQGFLLHRPQNIKDILL